MTASEHERNGWLFHRCYHFRKSETCLNIAAHRVQNYKILLNRSQFWGGLVFQGLLVSNDNINNVEKDLCEDYTISPDGITYVFVLKDDVYWHDGEKLTVDDVLFSIETCILAQEVNGYLKKGIQGIGGVKMFEKGQSDSILGIDVDGNSLTIKLAAVL